MNTTLASAETRRLTAANAGTEPWRRWGPYLAERQWGTVREDYSTNGTAWDYFPHDHARSRAYRWAEDGLAGISDDKSRLCLALALWNGRDPILKERLFGLTNSQGNHGEDVKELYYYLDATPTNSWLKYLYKYPQREYPYAELIEENRRRGKDQPEFELLDTGILDDDRYFDVFVEYAKAEPENLLMKVTIYNRGPESATLHLLTQLWFRNTWSWASGAPKPIIRQTDLVTNRLLVDHSELGKYEFLCADSPEFLFTENETNTGRLYGHTQAAGFFKDAFHDYIVGDNRDAVNSSKTGTKAAAYYQLEVPAGGAREIRVRLRQRLTESPGDRPRGTSRRGADSPFEDFETVFAARRREADEFYAALQHDLEDPDARLVQRQAFAGLLWSKQFYHYNVCDWLHGDSAQPPPAERLEGRNRDWEHLNSAEVISMPDKWEFPWFAAWDLGFHCLPLTLVDAEYAKNQLILLTREWFMHPNGELPAYEWSFGDVNPPVHAWSAWRVFQMDRKQRRTRHPKDSGDLAFLERVFHKLLLNFTWWVNRQDSGGRNVFQGGFLGLDNIGVFDRSAPLPTGGVINQADGTSWMAMYCLNLMRIALELAQHNRVYEDIATKFFEHFLHIAAAINGVSNSHRGLWDEADEFYYDQLQLPDGTSTPLKVRSMVGLIPLFAVETIEPELLETLPGFSERLTWFLERRPNLARLVSRWHVGGKNDRRLLSLLRGHRVKCLLRRMLDETEFLSDFGVRSLSKAYEHDPYHFAGCGEHHEVPYWAGESRGGLFGGNSNWRGPVWMPVNFLLIESLQKFHHYYGDDFQVECPTGSGQFSTLSGVAEELARRLSRIFLKGKTGTRPVLDYHPKLARDPYFVDHLLFHEYFHGDTGRGVGANHQTGWSSLITKLLQPRRETIEEPSPKSAISISTNNQSRKPAQ